MQFSVATIFALATSASAAAWVNNYNTTSIAVAHPTGTGVVPSGTGLPPSATTDLFSSVTPFPGAASEMKAGSALAMVIAGGVALMI